MVYHKRLVEDLTEPPAFKRGSVSLADKHPEAGAYWDFKRNCGWGPEDFASGSGILAWFKCPGGKDHIYQTQIKKWSQAQQTSTRGCPFCHGTYVSETNWLHTYPDIAAELISKGNRGVTAKTVTAGSGRLLWWKCKGCGNEWQATVTDRVQGHGCYVCNLGEHTDLRKYPKALRMFDRRKNKDIDPHRLLKDTAVWWRCPRAADHQFFQRFYKSNYPNSPRCPFCFTSKPSSTNNLSLDRLLGDQFHPTKNGKIKPKDVALNSQERIWWKCPKAPDHEWQACVAVRYYDGTGCPFCSHHRASAANNLWVSHRKLSMQWHPTKNREWTPRDFTCNSSQRVWWKCPNGPDHEWKGMIATRTGSNTASMGCPFCAGRRVSVTNSLATHFPKVAAMFHPTRNGSLKSNQLTAGAAQRVWWLCPKSKDHVWEESVSALTSAGQGCPFCANNRVSTTNSIAALYPDLAKQWHPKKNESLRPKDVIAGSHKKVWWKCKLGPDHEWEEMPLRRCYQQIGCPFCAGRRASITNCLATRDPKTAEQWHPTKNGTLTPSAVTAGSHTVVWWKCAAASDHEWQQSVKGRVGRQCPFCTSRRVAPSSSLGGLFPIIAKEFHKTKNGTLTPFELGPHSARKVWWQCSKFRNHVWKAQVNSRTASGSGCPHCYRSGR